MLRPSGIKLVGDTSWGTHFCHFYETKKDLLDIVVPYFKAGLENNEKCVWVTSEFLNTQEALEAMQKAIPNFASYRKKGQIEVFPHTQWYLRGGKFEMKRVLRDWLKKHKKSIEEGYEGLRVNGNPFWLESKKDWKDFNLYEQEINKVIHEFKILVLCSYSLLKCSPSEMIDVITSHEFALIKRKGKWENIKTQGQIKTERELLQSKIMFKSIVDSSPVAIYLAEGLEQKANYINPQFTKLFGYTLKDIPKASYWFSLAYPQRAYRQKMEREWKRRIAIASKTGNPIKPMEAVATCKNGSKRHILWNFSSIGEKNISYGLDLTERINNEKRLIISEKKFKTIFDSSPISIVLVNWDRKIMDANKAAVAMAGYSSRDSIIGKDVLDFADPSNYQLAHLGWKTLLKEGAIYGLEILLPTAAGKNLNILVSGVVLYDEKGSAESVILMAQDITERKELEKRKDDFINIASHELKTPLTSIKAYTQFIKRELIKRQEIKFTRIMSRVDTQVNKLVDMINEMLDVSRIQAGKLFLKKRKISLDRLIEDSIRDLDITVNSNVTQGDQPFVFSFPKKSGAIVKADDYRISQVVNNLVLNAVKYSTVNRNIIISAEKNRHYVKVSVKDNGIGIPKNKHRHLFERFYQVSEQKLHNNEFASLGLGLYICSNIIKYHKGKIWLESEPGKGSTFTFSLPIN